MKHHTKTKGDIGLGCIVVDLMKHDIAPALPMSEHLKFDCIAINEEGKMARVSVKYRTKDARGNVFLHLKSVYADKRGNHINKHKKSDYECTAIYCPDTDKCYYVRNDELDIGSITLRIDKTKNGQVSGIKWAKDYEDPHRIFRKSKKNK